MQGEETSTTLEDKNNSYTGLLPQVTRAGAEIFLTESIAMSERLEGGKRRK